MEWLTREEKGELYRVSIKYDKVTFDASDATKDICDHYLSKKKIIISSKLKDYTNSADYVNDSIQCDPSGRIIQQDFYSLEITEILINELNNDIKTLEDKFDRIIRNQKRFFGTLDSLILDNKYNEALTHIQKSSAPKSCCLTYERNRLQSPFLKACIIHAISSDQSADDIKQIITLLRDKNFRLYLASNSELEPFILEKIIALQACFKGNKDANKIFEDDFINTPGLITNYPQSNTDFHYTLDLNLFNGDLKNSNSELFQDITTYFIQVSTLLSDTETCLELLKTLDNELGRSLEHFDIDNCIPEGYFSLRNDAWPLPRNTYKPQSKDQRLPKLVAKMLSEHGGFTLYSSFTDTADFWHALGFIDSPLANLLIKEGQLFLDKGYSAGANLHGYISHPLLILILCLAASSGKIIPPQGKTVQEMIGYTVDSRALHYAQRNLWEIFIDATGIQNFFSPAFLHSTIMSPRGQQHCPILSAYLRSHFWNTYNRSATEMNTNIYALMLFDCLLEGNFLDKKYINLKNHYERQKQEMTYYSTDSNHAFLLFKKSNHHDVSTPKEGPEPRPTHDHLI